MSKYHCEKGELSAPLRSDRVEKMKRYASFSCRPCGDISVLDKGILIRRDDLMNVMFHCENGELSAPLRSDRVEKMKGYTFFSCRPSGDISVLDKGRKVVGMSVVKMDTFQIDFVEIPPCS